MPAPLLKAPQQLDGAVDRCYRPEPFLSDRHRVEYLFALCIDSRENLAQAGSGFEPGTNGCCNFDNASGVYRV
jgi:hypothetical protein